MKKLFTVLLSAALVFTPTLVGCSDDEAGDEPLEASEEQDQGDEETAKKKAEEEKKAKEAAQKKKEEEEAKRKAEEEAKKPPHILYSDISISAIRDIRGTYSTIYVVLDLTANCEKDSGYYDQAVIMCKVNDRDPYDMHPLPADWDLRENQGKSYSNEHLRCSTRFEANPGDSVTFWVEDPSSGATYEGLDGVIDQLTASTTEAINTSPESSTSGDSRTCYVTPTGYAYHSKRGCPRLSRSTELYEMTVEDAKDDGYEACDFCY